MAITYIGYSTTTKASGSNSLTITKPSGTKDGDLLIAFIGVDAADSITAPSGWTEIYDDADSNDVRGAAYYKIADGEGSNYTFTIGGTGHKTCGGIACYRGVNEANPINAYANRDDDNAINSPWATSVTTDVDGCQILVCIAQEDIYTYSPPGGYAEVWDINEGISDGVSLTMAHKSQSSAGTACPAGCSFSELGGDTDDYVAGTVALEPMSDPHAGEGTVHDKDSHHKFLVLDNDYALIEDWTDLQYTRERFGLGSFFITLPLDHNLSSSLDQYKRILIVRGDEDWTNQEARFWGVILNVKKFYARDAGPDLGESGIGAAYITAWGVTFTDYFLSGRVYPLPDAVELNPDGAGTFTDWTGDYTDVDEGIDDHDGDATYIESSTNCDTETVTLGDYADQGTAIFGIRVRSVWKTPSAGVLTPHVVLRVPNYNEILCDPSGNGGDTDWAGDYQDVDDGYSTPDDDASYIASSTIGHQESFTVPEPGLARNAVFPWLVVWFRSRKTTADTVVIKPYVVISGTRYYGTQQSLTTSYVNWYEIWNANPADSDSWEVSDLDNIEIGVEVVTCDGGEARVTMMCLAAPYLFQYELDQVEDSYAERYVDVEENPGTLAAWTESDLDSLEVGVRLTENRTARVTAIGVTVYHRAISTTGALDDVLKSWVNANLGSGAISGRQITGFTEEANESAGPSGTYEIAYNVLLQRFLELCKLHDVGIEVVGDWNDGDTRLDASPSYTFRTSYPEGVDRTYNNGVFDPVIISRGRGIVQSLDYDLGTVSARNYLYVLGDRIGVAETLQEVEGNRPSLAKEDSGLLLKEDGFRLLLDHIPAFYRREAVLDVEDTDDTSVLSDQGNKFLGDEGAELEIVTYGHSPQDICIPLTDFWPGDIVTYYDDKLSIGPLAVKVEKVACEVPSSGVEQYEVTLGEAKRPSLSEDAAFRAAGKRKTIYIKK